MKTIVLILMLLSMNSLLWGFEFTSAEKEFLEKQIPLADLEVFVGPKEEIDSFISNIGKNWRVILPNIDTLAPKAWHQIGIFAAAESLSGKEYMEFMNEVCIQAKAGKVDISALMLGVRSVTLKKRCFFASNYENTDVISLIKNFEEIFQKHNVNGGYDSLLVSLKKILTGESLRNSEYNFWLIKEAGLPPPEILPDSDTIKDALPTEKGATTHAEFSTERDFLRFFVYSLLGVFILSVCFYFIRRKFNKK